MPAPKALFAQEHEEWVNATSFQDLLELNKKYLRGESSSTPYYGGPVEEHTHSFIPHLLKLHERQIFTWGCGSYAHKIRQENTGEYIECRDRPHLCFIVAEENMPLKLFQELKKKNPIKVRAQKLYSSDPMVRGSFTGKTIVGKYRTSRYRLALGGRKWKVSEAFIDNMEEFSEEDIFTLEAFRQIRPWAFDVVAASWKDINVPEIVLGAANAVGHSR